MQDESRACLGVNQLPAAILDVSEARTAHSADAMLTRRAGRTSTNQKKIYEFIYSFILLRCTHGSSPGGGPRGDRDTLTMLASLSLNRSSSVPETAAAAVQVVASIGHKRGRRKKRKNNNIDRGVFYCSSFFKKKEETKRNKRLEHERSASLGQATVCNGTHTLVGSYIPHKNRVKISKFTYVFEEAVHEIGRGSLVG